MVVDAQTRHLNAAVRVSRGAALFTFGRQPRKVTFVRYQTNRFETTEYELTAR